MPGIGFLSGRSTKDSVRVVDAFGRGLRSAGYTEGKNLSVEYRWAEGKLDRLPELAADLVRRPVTVLVAAFKYVAHSKLAADLLHIHGPANKVARLKRASSAIETHRVCNTIRGRPEVIGGRSKRRD
jgi:hypothetical protein